MAAPSKALHFKGVDEGGGRALALPELKRDQRIYLMVTRGERADLQAIAEGWNVPPSTAAYGLLATELNRARGRAAVNSPALTLPLSVAIDALRVNGWHVTHRSE